MKRKKAEETIGEAEGTLEETITEDPEVLLPKEIIKPKGGFNAYT